MKKVFCIVISLVVLMSNCVIASASTIHNPVKVGSTSVWDCIWFGEYPQSYISSKNTLYPYFDTHFEISGWTFKENNNKVFHCGTYIKYWQIGTRAYFKFEPIKWRVLKVEGSKALVVSDKILERVFYRYLPDGYNNKRIEIDPGDIDYTHWKQSAIREYMKNMFINMFSSNEFDAILTTPIKARYPSKDEEIEETTLDDIFLLSYEDANNSSYGFNMSDPNTIKAEATDLAKVRCHADERFEFEDWGYRLLTGGWIINQNGKAIQKNEYLLSGVRPAMWIDLSKENYQYAGTVKSDGTGTEILFNLGKSKVTKATKSSKKSKKLKVNLKAVTYADGQQVKVYTTKKKAKSNKKAIFNKKTTKINNKFKSKKFKNKKKLYVRARGYVKKNGKTKYGAWSKIKKVTKK